MCLFVCVYFYNLFFLFSSSKKKGKEVKHSNMDVITKEKKKKIKELIALIQLIRVDDFDLNNF